MYSIGTSRQKGTRPSQNRVTRNIKKVISKVPLDGLTAHTHNRLLGELQEDGCTEVIRTQLKTSEIHKSQAELPRQRRRH